MDAALEQEPRPHFAPTQGFRKELNARVAAYFKDNNLPERDVPSMYFKTAIIVAWIVSCYYVLVFTQAPWFIKIPVALFMGLGTSAAVFNIGHDANHMAYSNRNWVNHLMALSFDLNGATSSLWRYRHNIIHHTYTNIAGVDFDISSAAPMMRMTPQDPWYAHHRYQHLFFPFFYMFLTPNWLVSDFIAMFVSGKYLGLHVSRPTTMDKVMWVAGKISVICFLLVIPLSMGWAFWQLAIVVFLHYAVMGIMLAVVFQLAHVVEEVSVIIPERQDVTLDDEFAIHQIKTSADFAVNSGFWSWYLGGLNFQCVHHLLPRICHVHYPKLQPIVEQLCRERGVPYVANPTTWHAVRSHWRRMKYLTVANPEASNLVAAAKAMAQQAGGSTQGASPGAAAPAA